ncbi:MAG: glycosyltransferase family 2 protein [Elusimicrobiota bacterium]
MQYSSVKKKRPFVSCIIPSQNMAEFLSDAIESILAQNFPEAEREIIVVDDGSTDNTAEVLKRYKDKIRSIYQADLGQGESYRNAIKIARGEIIAALDADDVWKPQKLSRISEAFCRRKDVVAVSHPVLVVDKTLRPMYPAHSLIPKDSLINLNSKTESLEALSNLFSCCGCWSAKKTVIADRPFRYTYPRLTADRFYLYLALSEGGTALFLSDYLAYYRQHEKNAGSNSNYGRVEHSLNATILASLFVSPTKTPVLDQCVRHTITGACARLLSLKKEPAHTVS